MFWGLIMEPKRRYTQIVKRPFHISMAALDIFSADDEPTQVMLFFEERNYLLCTLLKGQTLQCALDLNFEMGDEVVFATNGNSNIHLSGYIQEEFDEFPDDEEEEEEEEEVEESKVKKNRKKKNKENSSEEQPPNKKSKLAKLLEYEYDSDDEDESFVLSEDVEDEEDGGDLDEEYVEDEEADDDVEEEEEVVEDDKSDVSSLSENEVKSPKKQINGKKATSRKKQQNTLHQEVTKSEKKTTNEKTPMKTTKIDAQQKNIKTPKFGESPVQPEQKKTLEGGVVIQDLKVGEGHVAKPGKMLQVYYVGRLKQNNKLFDQSNKGAGFKFRLGKQEVIKAWDVGVVGMKVGGRRRIVCPPAMAYGQKGAPPAIPPNSSLVFEVELKNII